MSGSHNLFLQLLTALVFISAPLAAGQNVRSQGNEEVVLGLAGDTMLGRLVDEVIGENGYLHPWGDMLPILRSTHLNLINLETTLTRSTKKTPKIFNFRASPDRAKSLLEARIKVCNLANNHILDFGVEGMQETIGVLDQAGIAHVGAGLSIKKAREPLILELSGIRIGILGCTDNERLWEAGATRPGTYFVSVSESEDLESRVKELARRVDLLILSIHWGPNMRREPPQAFVRFAHRLVDAGIDVFHGHSAHIPQGIEVYRGGIIFYDNGDFVDDYRVTPELRNDQSFFALVRAGVTGIRSVQLIPTLISNMQVNRASGSDYTEIVERIKRLSEVFDTQVIEQKSKVWVSLPEGFSEQGKERRHEPLTFYQIERLLGDQNSEGS